MIERVGITDYRPVSNFLESVWKSELNADFSESVIDITY